MPNQASRRQARLSRALDEHDRELPAVKARFHYQVCGREGGLGVPFLSALRIETTINQPQGYKVFRTKEGQDDAAKMNKKGAVARSPMASAAAPHKERLLSP
jgi:hypothetical protein